MNLNLQPGPFNLPTAIALCGCAQRAYDAPTIATPLAHARIEEYDDAVVLAFRGTACVRDLITDSECEKIRVGPYKIHAGFWAALESIQSQIVLRLANTEKPVWLTGHSLGGALARLAAEFIWFTQPSALNPQPSAIYTFGEPRGGDGPLADACHAKFGARHYRVEHHLDVVTRLPGWLPGYRHSGRLIHLPETGPWQENPVLMAKVWQDLCDLHRARRAGLLGEFKLMDRLLADHHLSHYAAKLEELSLEAGGIRRESDQSSVEAQNNLSAAANQ